jgi:hypothetical protein
VPLACYHTVIITKAVVRCYAHTCIRRVCAAVCLSLSLPKQIYMPQTRATAAAIAFVVCAWPQ